MMENRGFSSYIEGVSLPQAEKAALQKTHNNGEVSRYAYAQVCMEGGFYGCTTVTCLVFGVSSDVLDIRLAMDVESFVKISAILSTIRFSTAYIVSRQFDIPRPLQYAGLQTIPILGKPIAIGSRIPEHANYLSYYERYIRMRVQGALSSVSSLFLNLASHHTYTQITTSAPLYLI